VEDKYPSGGRIPERFPPGNEPPCHSSELPVARLAPGPIFSNVFTNLRSNAALSFSRQPRPPPPLPEEKRVIRPRAREYARTRDRRAGCPLFSSPPSRGWNSFRGPTPSSCHEWHRSIASIILTLFLEAHPFVRARLALSRVSFCRRSRSSVLVS